METDDFSFFCDLLDSVLQNGVLEVEVLDEPGMVEAPFCWKFKVPRLSVCLSGTQSRMMRRGGVTVTMEQGPREGYLLAPGCWMGTDPQKPYESLQIRFDRRATNFVVFRFAGGPGALEGFPASTIHRSYSSPRLLDPIGHELHRFLLHPPLVGARDYKRSLFTALLCKAREALIATPPGSKAQQTWQAARHFIEEHCEQPLSRDSVAGFLKLHPNYLSQLFAQQSEESFSGFLLRVRLERARHLLEDPGLNVSEVARLSGFADANYFIRAFKKRYALTPGRARQAATPR